MELNLFLRRASKRERSDVAEACHDSVGYLYQIAGRHRFASPQLAIQIERATKIVAEGSNGRLALVARTSMVKHPEIFYDVDQLAANDPVVEEDSYDDVF